MPNKKALKLAPGRGGVGGWPSWRFYHVVIIYSLFSPGLLDALCWWYAMTYHSSPLNVFSQMLATVKSMVCIFLVLPGHVAAIGGDCWQSHTRYIYWSRVSMRYHCRISHHTRFGLWQSQIMMGIYKGDIGIVFN